MLKRIIPLIFSPTYLNKTAILNKVKLNKDYTSGIILDIGCGNKPYKEFLPHTKYIGLDIENEGHNHNNEEIDIFYDGINIPFRNNKFDSIVCFQTVEHVKDIEKLIKEMKRVLKPGGLLLATFPFIWNLHELPNDYRRLTPEGAKKLFENEGFVIIKQEKIMDDFSLYFQINQLFICELKDKLGKPLSYIFTPLTFFNNIFGILTQSIKLRNLYGDNLIIVKKIK
ncbi:MAG: class I SAM-dependent methyltransferase [Sphaerochaetaceae bacterium]|nr:class I SAM-dependent methyltransferase [Sphaerochaetaceae bacterium]